MNMDNFFLQRFPWHPEPVEVFDEVSGPKVNDEACLIYIPAGGNRLRYFCATNTWPIVRACDKTCSVW